MVHICRPFCIEWIPFTLTNQCAFMATSSREGERAALIAPHQAEVANNVCGQDRRQFALLTGHGMGGTCDSLRLPIVPRLRKLLASFRKANAVACPVLEEALLLRLPCGFSRQTFLNVKRFRNVAQRHVLHRPISGSPRKLVNYKTFQCGTKAGLRTTRFPQLTSSLLTGFDLRPSECRASWSG
jgi:hypothetical protein